MEKSTRQILIDAKELISDPAKWIKGNLSTTETGRVVSSTHSDAKCFCSLGAVAHVAKASDSRGMAIALLYKTSLDIVPGRIEYPNLITFNDHESTTHDDIIKLFNKAIADLPDPNKEE